MAITLNAMHAHTTHILLSSWSLWLLTTYSLSQHTATGTRVKDTPKLHKSIAQKYGEVVIASSLFSRRLSLPEQQTIGFHSFDGEGNGLL